MREEKNHHLEIARTFLDLGATAFGGPAVHISRMEAEFVRKRGWLSKERFLELLGFVNLLPGPSSTQLAISIGAERGGISGLVIAGSCFILPAALSVGLIAWAYSLYGQLPAAQGIFFGVKPAMVAVVAQALLAFSRKNLGSRLPLALAILALAAGLTGLPLLGSLLVLGLAGAIFRQPPWRNNLLGVEPVSLLQLGLFFLKAGSLVFGSGYVLLAFLEGDLVHRYGWISGGQLLDAIAVGQFTPGPLFTTATFLGFLLAGLPGAVIATLAVFVPSFFFVAAASRVQPLLSHFPFARAFLESAGAASIGLMGAVTVQLGRAALVDAGTFVWAALCFALLAWKEINSIWLIVAGALLGASGLL
jgi:chromate transporter